MAKKKLTKSKSSPKVASERIVMRTGEALVEVEGGPAYLACEPKWSSANWMVPSAFPLPR